MVEGHHENLEKINLRRKELVLRSRLGILSFTKTQWQKS